MHDLLRVLSIIAAMCGIGFGLMTIPTGLFVGPHILLAAVAEIVVGTLFALAAIAMTNHKSWGVWLALASALVTGGVGILASSKRRFAPKRCNGYSSHSSPPTLCSWPGSPPISPRGRKWVLDRMFTAC